MRLLLHFVFVLSFLFVMIVNISCDFYNFQGGPLQHIQKLIAEGGDINKKDKNGDRPLHDAVIFNSIEIVKELLKNGADINASNKDGKTPLHLAVLYCKMDEIEKLLKHGAKTDIKNHSEKTVLELAREEGRGVLLRVLEHASGTS